MKKKIFSILLVLPLISIGQISMNVAGSYNQNFNTLSNSGNDNSWTDNSTITNWFSQRSVLGAVTYNAGIGSSNIGKTYSFGATADVERALGGVSSGTYGNISHGVLLQNTSNNIIEDLTVSYTLEQWRDGGNSVPTSQDLRVYYQISNTIISALEPAQNLYWIEVPGLLTMSPVFTVTPGALDGNNSLNKVTLNSIAIPNLSLTSGQYIMIKWEDPNHAGSDHGMAIDDVTIDWTISCNTSYSYTETACDTYTVPSGDETYTSSGIVLDTIPNTGCGDSILTINLTIETSSLYYLDSDMDGYGDINNPLVTCNIVVNYVGNSMDCDDNDFNVNIPQTYFIDFDNDGFGDANSSGLTFCSNPGLGFSINANDCDDLSATVSPGALELCDGIDNDCDLDIDEGLAVLNYYLDNDQDNFGSGVLLSFCQDPGLGYSTVDTDCDDANSNSYPGAVEILNNGIDENCDGTDNYLGLEDTNLDFSIQPNPSNGIFTINFHQITSGKIECLDMNGKLLNSFDLVDSILNCDLSELALGTYILKIKSENSVTQKRIVIQK